MPRNPNPEDTNDPTPAPKSRSRKSDQEPQSPPQGPGGLFLEGVPGPSGPTPDPSEWRPPLSDPSLSDAGSGALGSPTGSKPRSTRGSGGVKKRDLREVAAAAVQTVGGVVHTVLTRPETPERDAGLWLPDPDDVENISDPVAGLASRRVPEGADNPDAGDLVRLVMALLAYLVKQVSLRSEVGGRNRGPVDHDHDADATDAGQPEPSPDQGESAPDRPAAVSALLGRRSGLTGVGGDDQGPGPA